MDHVVRAVVILNFPIYALSFPPRPLDLSHSLRKNIMEFTTILMLLAGALIIVVMLFLFIFARAANVLD